MNDYVDIGARCDEHAGEVFPPRCATCEVTAAEWRASLPRVCQLHPMHFEPCTKCEALARESVEAVSV